MNNALLKKANTHYDRPRTVLRMCKFMIIKNEKNT